MAKANCKIITLLALLSAVSVLSSAQSATAEELLLLGNNPNGEKLNTGQLNIGPVASNQTSEGQYLDVSLETSASGEEGGIVLAQQEPKTMVAGQAEQLAQTEQPVQPVQPVQREQPVQTVQTVQAEQPVQPVQVVASAPLVSQATTPPPPLVVQEQALEAPLDTVPNSLGAQPASSSPFVWTEPPVGVASSTGEAIERAKSKQAKASSPPSPASIPPLVPTAPLEPLSIQPPADLGIVVQPQVPVSERTELKARPIARSAPIPKPSSVEENQAKVEEEKARIIENAEKVARQMNSTFACAAGVQYALSDAGLPEFMGTGDGWEMRQAFLNSPKWRVTDDPTKATAFVRAWTDDVVASYGDKYQARNLGHVGIIHYENGTPIELSDHRAVFNPNSSRYAQTIYFEYVG